MAIVGAAGGIGRHLVERFEKNHEVTGVVRSRPPRPDSGNAKYIAYDNGDLLGRCLQESDVVVHAALNKVAWSEKLVTANTRLTRTLLDRCAGGSCRLFVYFSSWVVYSGTEAATPAGYGEAQDIPESGKLDYYTRLKILDERLVAEACRQSGIGFLIVRPSIVVGSGLANPAAGIRMARLAPIGIKGRSINLIHVLDLASMLESLVTLGVANEVFNLGGDDYPSEDYFDQLGRVAGRRMRYPPLDRLLKRVPSTIWFVRTTARLDSSKVQRVTGIRPDRSLPELLSPGPVDGERAALIEKMQEIQRSGLPFKAYGAAYSVLIDPLRHRGREKRIRLDTYRGIVSRHGDLVTVKAGTPLAEISAFLDQVDLTLATLPEFVGNTAGACFFVDVHGSSSEYFSLFDLITEVKYLDRDGRLAVAKRNDAAWEELRRTESGVFLTEVTFKCVTAGYMTNRVEFKSDDLLVDYVDHEHRKNLSTVLEWYPAQQKFMVYNINRADSPPPRATRVFTTYRHSPYAFQRFISFFRMRKTDTQYGRYADVLSPWKKLPLQNLWFRRLPAKEPRYYDTEFLTTIRDGVLLIEHLRRLQREGNGVFGRLGYLGIRFAYKRTGAESRGFVWFDLATHKPDVVNRFVEAAFEVCAEGVDFHQGKYIPARWAEAPRPAF
ncbi:MAG: NAD-dependent epimerase/dehydratase family protein [Burkholderiales bacterium]